MKNVLLIVLIVTLAVCAVMRLERYEDISWLSESMRYLNTSANTCESVLESQGRDIKSYEEGHQQIISKLVSTIYQSPDGNKFTTGECLIPTKIMSDYKVPNTCVVDGTPLRIVGASQRLSNGATIKFDETGCAISPSHPNFTNVMGYMYGIQTEGQTKTIDKQNSAITAQNSTNTNTQQSTTSLNSDTTNTQNSITSFKGDNWSIETQNNGLESTSKYIAQANDGTLIKIGDLDVKIAAYKKLRDLVYDPWVASFCDNRWITPSRGMTNPGNPIARMLDINIADHTSKTYSFWLQINGMHSNWRNIFHVTNGPDLTRRPAVFIGPNSSYIHVCHDTLSSANNPFDIAVPYQQPVHIAITWLDNQCGVYINGTYVGGARYNNSLAPLRKVHSFDFDERTNPYQLYIADRFYSDGSFVIKNFKIHMFAMTGADILKEFQGWKCGVAGHLAPMRVNDRGNVECMSTNARDCVWAGSTRDCQAQISDRAAHVNTRAQIRPLECGEMHRQQWGGRGDDNPGHWCYKVKQAYM